MSELLETLRYRGWKIQYRTDANEFLPPTVAVRYPHIPPELVSFLASLELCCNATETSWFLTASDYAPLSSLGVRWNECECIEIDTTHDSQEQDEIRTFWDMHFPFMMAVHSDYDYLAVRLTEEGFGTVVHGYAPYWLEPAVIAPSFSAFLEAFALTAVTPERKYPLSVFL